jgi:hypothetical protein
MREWTTRVAVPLALAGLALTTISPPHATAAAHRATTAKAPPITLKTCARYGPGDLRTLAGAKFVLSGLKPGKYDVEVDFFVSGVFEWRASTSAVVRKSGQQVKGVEGTDNVMSVTGKLKCVPDSVVTIPKTMTVAGARVWNNPAVSSLTPVPPG